MDFALINPLLLSFTLLLSFIPKGQSLAHAAACHKKCLPGSYLVHADGICVCRECPVGLYTEKENESKSCIRCKRCAPTEIKKENCTTSKNTVCVCPSGKSKDGFNDVCVSDTGICQNCEVTDDPKCDCELCQRTKCENNPECRKKCEATLITTTSPPPSKELMLLLWLLPLVVVTSLVLLWLLLFFTKKLLRNRDCCLIWSANKDRPVKDLSCRELHSHQGCSSLTTPTVHMYEEAPMMSSCQSPPTAAPVAPAGLLLLDINHAVAIHEEQPDLWPAIVLYTIIKAVPLRRWKEFLRLLAVADHQLERVELEAGVGQSFMEKQYQMLRLWSQRSSAALADVFFALCHMNLSGCAQLLQESLEKLDWRPEPKQRGPMSFELSGAVQEAI